MGRYRPPQKPGSKYITREGFDRLQGELDQLWRIERPQITQSVREAAAQGDRSENADYIYGKKRLREIDSRVRFLRKRLENMTVADTLPSDTEKIYFGAWVALEDENGEIKRYRIVGPDEIDPKRGYISMDSPVAQLLMKKMVGDDIVVQTPKGEQEYYIQAIQYEPFE
jgi:transcription elongation factor GreB